MNSCVPPAGQCCDSGNTKTQTTSPTPSSAWSWAVGELDIATGNQERPVVFLAQDCDGKQVRQNALIGGAVDETVESVLQFRGADVVDLVRLLSLASRARTFWLCLIERHEATNAASTHHRTRTRSGSNAFLYTSNRVPKPARTRSSSREISILRCERLFLLSALTCMKGCQIYSAHVPAEPTPGARFGGQAALDPEIVEALTELATRLQQQGVSVGGKGARRHDERHDAL